jgi:hypothetical protein
MLMEDMLDELLQGGIRLLLKVLENGSFYALTLRADGVGIKWEHFLKPQARFCTDSPLLPTRFGSAEQHRDMSETQDYIYEALEPESKWDLDTQPRGACGAMYHFTTVHLTGKLTRGTVLRVSRTGC